MPEPKNNVGINHPKMRANVWKKGQSGNPNGRPKRESFESAVNRILEKQVGQDGVTKLEGIAERFVAEMLDGNSALFREFLSREWPATTQVDVTAQADVQFVSVEQYEDVSDWEDRVKVETDKREEPKELN